MPVKRQKAKPGASLRLPTLNGIVEVRGKDLEEVMAAWERLKKKSPWLKNTQVEKAKEG